MSDKAMKKPTYYIHINQHHIRHNRKPENKDKQIPPIVIKRGKYKNVATAYEVEIIGSSRLIYDAFQPILNCGARLVLVCDDYKIIR